jgi:hypothetical protein
MKPGYKQVLSDPSLDRSVLKGFGVIRHPFGGRFPALYAWKGLADHISLERRPIAPYPWESTSNPFESFLRLHGAGDHECIRHTETKWSDATNPVSTHRMKWGWMRGTPIPDHMGRTAGHGLQDDTRQRERPQPKRSFPFAYTRRPSRRIIPATWAYSRNLSLGLWPVSISYSVKST